MNIFKCIQQGKTVTRFSKVHTYVCMIHICMYMVMYDQQIDYVCNYIGPHV